MSLFLYTDLQPTSTTASTQHCIPGTTNVQSPSSSGESSCWTWICSHHKQILSPGSLLFQPPLLRAGLQTMTNGPMLQLVAVSLLPHRSPLPAVPFQRPRRAALSQPFPTLAWPLTQVQISLPGPSASWSFRRCSPAEDDGVDGGRSWNWCCWAPAIGMAVLLWGRERRAEHSCPLLHVTVGGVLHFCTLRFGEVLTFCKILAFAWALVASWQ